MSTRLAARVAHCKAAGRPAFVGFITAGFPTKDHTVNALLSMQAGGADIIELGIPFSDPLADGPTIQSSSNTALENGISVAGCLQLAKDARSAGVTVPIIFMGYVNPMLAYGFDKLAEDAKEAGIDGFIICDVPGEAAHSIIKSLNSNGLSFVPLVTPATSDDRIARLSALATGFIYVVSANGVTGQKDKVNAELPDFLARIRKHTDLPLMVGFGISKREHVENVSKIAEGVIVGSAIVAAARSAGEGAAPEAVADKLKELVSTLVGGTTLGETPEADVAGQAKLAADSSGFDDTAKEYMFGNFGGRYIPETLVAAHENLFREWTQLKDDPAYRAELARLRKDYVGGPTPIFKCENLTKACGGAEIWLKREDLAHTGAHKINNALGQALLAVKLGKKRIIAETGAGQHGVATATACALLGLECIIYMGAVDMKRQSLNVFKMNIMGAKCVPVTAGSQTLKDAVNEAMRDWVTNVETTHYIIGSAVGPHPFPEIVRDLQSVIGNEAREQFQETTGKLPDYVMACVGGGSNAIGMFHPFKDDESVQLIGVEAGGATGVAGGPGTHSLTLSHGTPGVLHGMNTFLLQDKDGQILHTHSISAGLDYPAVGPEHAFFKSIGRAQYVGANDDEAMDAFKMLSEKEGIIPALESAHGLAHAMKLAKTLPSDKTILLNLSGRGDKDMLHVAKILGVELNV